MPIARNIEVRNLQTKKAKYALYLRGFKDAPIGNVRVMDCDFEGVEKPDVIENVEKLLLAKVKENGKIVERT
jgi:hypothetical protein